MPSTTQEAPLRADARRNRERVLKAARHCFAEHGSEAQIDDIARKAKVGVGTLYRHFPTKSDLFHALATEHFATLAEVGHRALEIDDPWEALTTYFRECAQRVTEDRAVAEIMTADPEAMAQAAIEREDLQQTLAAVVERAQDAGVLRADIVPTDLPMFICALGKVSTGPGPYTSWERYIGIVLDGLRAKPKGTNELPPAPDDNWLDG